MKNNWINVSALMSGGLVSLCCGVPLALAVLGLGGLGLSSFIGQYHWYLTGAGIIALAAGWGMFLREKKKARQVGANLDNERFTVSVLGLVSVLVIFFSGLSVYSQVKDPGTNPISVTGKLLRVKVSGMTCSSCELHVESALKKLDGVYNVTASAKAGKITVDYDPARCDPNKITEAINGTGYKAIGVL